MGTIKRFFTGDNVLNNLLIFIPIALAMRYLFPIGDIFVFASSAIAIIPLAGLMGRATEHLAARLGEGIGGLLNATFGNAAELIIGLTALKAGHYNVVKASITGSIIGNVLLVFGVSAIAGGIKYRKQQFNTTAANVSSTMRALSAIGLIIPAMFHHVVHGTAENAEHHLSTYIAIVLMFTYLLNLVFTLKTHKHLYDDSDQSSASEDEITEEEAWSHTRSVAVLAISTAAIALISELLVSTIDGAAKTIGMSEVFVGVIVIAIVGNAAEHSTAVTMAMKNKMDLTMNIAIGSSIQMALFVAPVLVFLSYMVGPRPMDLLFSTFEVVSVGLAVVVSTMIANDGASNWIEGVQLVAVYLMLGIAFFFLPA